MKPCYWALLLFFTTSILSAQWPNKSFTVKYTLQPIKLDGILDEPVWKDAEGAKEFWQYFPADSIQATKQSFIQMLYDETNLYIGITVYTAGENYAIQSLKRDFRAGNSDNITLLFDTFNDANNAFIFGTNPYGVRREGLLAGGGLDRRGFNFSWDVKWRGESKIYEGYYTSEMVIPLSSFKFSEGVRKWRFNSYRFDTQSNETSTWVQVPTNQNIYSLSFMGEMIFEKPLGKSRTPLAIIPYINTSLSEDFEAGDSDSNLKVGGDAKVAIGNSMNLDITLNPDFSQVEVDDQVVNLTRFEIGLPEKRQFFIDNSDLFSSFGGGRDANPFFSRRIGIARDTADNNVENPIIAGARLSGKLNNNLRLGFFHIVTEEDANLEIPSNHNTMLALQQKVFDRSNISFFYINRETFKDYDFLSEEDRFNRVVGMDYNLISATNIWNGKFYLHKSFESENTDTPWSAGFNLNYNTRNWNIFTDLVYVGEDFRSDLGFVRRTDILKGAMGLERVFWPSKGAIQNHSFRIFPIVTWSPESDLLNSDYNIMTTWSARFQDQSRLEVEISNRYTYLFEDFEPTGRDNAVSLPGLEGYYYNGIELEYSSDRRRLFSFGIEPSYGGFYNGKRLSLQGDLGLRIQPKIFLSMRFNYDHIDLPDPYARADIWLISPKFDITFNKNLFWSTLIQYTNQNDNLGINSRLQWRFAPLSDLFLVYNDNYFVNSFMPKLRSINLKLTYWLNI